MSRNTGTFNFAANFEGLLKAPIDAKQVIGTYADLTLPATWCASGQVWLYDGAIVAVAGGACSGIYWLCDSNNYTMTCSWVKAGSGSGTLSGATNGLHLINGGTVVALGGNLTSGTTISGQGLHNLSITNINEFQVSTSGITPTLFGLDSTGILMSTSGTSVTLNTTEGLIYGSGYTSSNPYWIPTKLYVDGVAIGLNVHPAVWVATTSGITLSGLTTVDGIATTAGMRVLVKNQLIGADNGIYSADTGTWGRTADYNFVPPGEVSNGDLIPVTSGQTQYNSLWALTSPNPVVSGNTLTFTLFSMPTHFIAGSGIQIIVNTISLDDQTQDIVNLALTGATGGLGTDGNRNVCLDSISQAILANAITGATNGLGTDGNRNVCLGGKLSVPTIINLSGQTFTICGAPGNAFIELNDSSLSACFGTNSASTTELRNNLYSLTLSSAPFANFHDNNCVGLCYDGNYEANFVPRSLVTKQYVLGQITGFTGSITGGTNGLGATGMNICLGGTLLNNTTINANTHTLCVNNGFLSTESGYQISGVTILKAGSNDIDSIYIGDNANFNIIGTDNIGIGSWSLKSTTTGSNNLAIGAASLSAITTGSGNVAIGYNAGMHETGSNKLIIANNANTCLIHGDFSTSGLTFNANICLGLQPSSGTTSDAVLVWNNSTKCVQRLSVATITGATAISANNGLNKAGKNIRLGGDLTGSTCICTQSFSLNIGCSINVGLGIDSTAVSAFHCLNASNGSAFAISDTGITLSNKTSSVSCLVTLGANALVYGGCYHSCYVNRTLVDKEYVDKQISGCSNILNVRRVCNTYYTTRYDDVITVSGISSNQIYLFPAPVLGERISVVDICGNALADPITINGYGNQINNGTCSTINTDYGSVTFVWNGIFWSAIAFVN